jgi:hypothetical protein
VDDEGRPRVVYHGTAEEFWAFDKGRLASSTGHMSAPLGFFFAESRASAERVIDAYLAIRNPKRMTVEELMEIDSREDACALRERLQREGYDGIHIANANQWWRSSRRR